MRPSDSSEKTAPAPAVIGIDIGKDVFHVVGFDADGKIALRRKISAWRLPTRFASCLPAPSGWKHA
jgi:transposase